MLELNVVLIFWESEFILKNTVALFSKEKQDGDDLILKNNAKKIKPPPAHNRL